MVMWVVGPTIMDHLSYLRKEFDPKASIINTALRKILSIILLIPNNTQLQLYYQLAVEQLLLIALAHIAASDQF